MSEEIKKEESAPVESQKEMSRTEMERQRQFYVKERKKELEVLVLDTEFMELQIRHYEASKKIKALNAEAEAAAKAVADRKSKDFEKSLKV